MTMNPLPPQAYTKDTMLKAYQWLMLQNSSIKEMATTPDILVSLYLKATRDGDSALDRPSIKNFKNELRNLAGMMGELDGGHRQAPVAPPAQQVQAATPPAHQKLVAPAAVNTAPPVAPAAQPVYQNKATHHQVSYTEKTLTATTQMPSFIEQLDDCSIEMIREVKIEFNLSSELEAVRMLIKIGHSKAKNILK